MTSNNDQMLKLMQLADVIESIQAADVVKSAQIAEIHDLIESQKNEAAATMISLKYFANTKDSQRVIADS